MMMMMMIINRGSLKHLTLFVFAQQNISRKYLDLDDYRPHPHALSQGLDLALIPSLCVR